MRTNSKQFQYVSDLCTGNYTWAYKSSVVWRAAMTLANLNLWPLCHELCALSISASSRHSLLIILIYAIIYRSAYITNPNCISASLVVGALLAIALDLNFVCHVAILPTAICLGFALCFIYCCYCIGLWRIINLLIFKKTKNCAFESYLL